MYFVVWWQVQSILYRPVEQNVENSGGLRTGSVEAPTALDGGGETAPPISCPRTDERVRLVGPSYTQAIFLVWSPVSATAFLGHGGLMADGHSVVPAAAILLLVFLAGCDGQSTGAPARAADSASDTQEWFVDRAKEAGLDFVHFNGMSGEFYFPENMAPGVGLLDYDNDGDLDVYLVQGQMLGEGKTPGDALLPPQGPLPPRDRLYRNDLQVHPDGTRTLRFTDVTDQSGMDGRGFGMGVAAGDYNNDGWVDLYVTRLGRNAMFRNNGDGTFTDVTRQSGTDDPAWSVSAAFVDVDRDGWLDLYVGNYVRYSIERDIRCASAAGARDYCPPAVYGAQPDVLYRNQGNGTFVDITAKAQMAGTYGPALGVATADYDGDGWIDIYVANDGQENQLWINQRDGTFRNTALLAGAAVPEHGRPEASMGVDAGDFDNDGDEDLFMTEVTSEGHNLYVNDGSGVFEDRSAASGLGSASLAFTGFGTAWLDFDNDGRLDLLTVNGAIVAIEAQRRAQDPFPYRQRKQLFHNLGDGRLQEVTESAGAALQALDASRGAAFGDIDNDGDIDVLIGNATGPTRLLLNNVGHRNHWVGVRLVGTEASRDMLGARVEVVRRDGSVIWRRARSDGSYASANDPRVLVGLGTSTEPPRVRVRWPNGRVEEWPDVPVDRWTTLEEGTQR